jgi:uncharacterized protein YjlB
VHILHIYQHRHKFGRVLLLVIIAHSAEIVFGRNKPVEKARRRDDRLVEAAGKGHNRCERSPCLIVEWLLFR